MNGNLFEYKWAEFSECRTYRYALWRIWDKRTPYVMFICLNPSTADELKDDPTVKRCIGFAKDWGYGGLCMTNLFALRATEPRVMLAHPSPVGPENDRWLFEIASNAGKIIAAWGTNGGHLGRDKEIIKKIAPLHCLIKTKDGFPGHPLFLKSTVKPVRMEARRGE